MALSAVPALMCRSTRRIPLPRVRCLSTTGAAAPVDVAVVGGGIVGLATAAELLTRYPEARVAVLEKESKIAQHQSSHNSGVIHAGIYYKPGSTIARLCVEGLKLMYKYCDEKGIAYKRCGKLVVATNDAELATLDVLYERSVANKVPDVQLIDAREVTEMEPHIEALRAIYSPWTGIINYADVAAQLAKDIEATGRGNILTSFQVVSAEQGSDVNIKATDGRSIAAKHVVTCAGLQADRVARLFGGKRDPLVLPFRGSYQEVLPAHRHITERNIYPAPESYTQLRFPSIGVHITPRMDGRLLLGPNAALAFSREGYKFFDVNLRDLLEAGTHIGLWRLVLGNLNVALQEIWRDVNTAAFVAEVQKYCPGLKLEHTQRSSGVEGVHAIAINNDGSLVSDFIFETVGDRVLNVRNAPSPAATSSLAIAKDVCDRAAADFGW